MVSDAFEIETLSVDGRSFLVTGEHVTVSRERDGYGVRVVSDESFEVDRVEEWVNDDVRLALDADDRARLMPAIVEAIGLELERLDRVQSAYRARMASAARRAS